MRVFQSAGGAFEHPFLPIGWDPNVPFFKSLNLQSLPERIVNFRIDRRNTGTLSLLFMENPHSLL